MQAQTKSLAQALQNAQQAMQDTRQTTNAAPKQARQGADRVPPDGRQQGASAPSSSARQTTAPRKARQVIDVMAHAALTMAWGWQSSRSGLQLTEYAVTLGCQRC